MKPGHDEKRRDLICWNKDAHTQTLRVELADASFYIFPYHRLQFVRFESGTDQDQLRLILDTQEIRIAGKNLRELGLAFQKLSVEWVRELPARYVATADADTCSISRIEVREVGELA